ncbi:hypothetical protein K8O68_00285 [Salipaludibacillus sp. CUR1]|uniref:hypothetical protein n=1 Tax=Salipaludibacillus sp. CUR1 TaxID=2820003 RepID=UPI001E386195|nr:hypothetical protein [Salipaludibacillus sp. CUR1]MCE7790855.1 hypothetical protein [Salipaludibacillus sp. CUR1]
MSRTTEMVLGILGGLIGFCGAFFALFIGSIDEAVSGSNQILGLGTSAFIFSGLAVLGGIVVKFNPKLGGWLLLISGVAILISISLFGVVPALLLVPAGLMGIIRKPKQQAAAA